MPCNNLTSSTYDCEQELRHLYNTYMRLVSGRAVSEQQDSEYRRVKFAGGDPEVILNMYNSLYAQCGCNTDLPDLRYVNAPRQGALQFTR